MYTLIATLIPSVIGVKIIEHLNKGLSLKNTIYYYLILLVLSTLLNNLISILLFKIDDDILNVLNITALYFCQYTSISIIINVLLSLIFVVIMKNISFNIEVKENAKTIKNKNKKNTKKFKKNSLK